MRKCCTSFVAFFWSTESLKIVFFISYDDKFCFNWKSCCWYNSSYRPFFLYYRELVSGQHYEKKKKEIRMLLGHYIPVCVLKTAIYMFWLPWEYQKNKRFFDVFKENQNPVYSSFQSIKGNIVIFSRSDLLLFNSFMTEADII